MAYTQQENILLVILNTIFCYHVLSTLTSTWKVEWRDLFRVIPGMEWWNIRKDWYYFYCSTVDEPYWTASTVQTHSKILLAFFLVRYILFKWYSTFNSISFMDKFTQRAEFLMAGIIPLLKSILFEEYYVWNILRSAIK